MNLARRVGSESSWEESAERRTGLVRSGRSNGVPFSNATCEGLPPALPCGRPHQVDSVPREGVRGRDGRSTLRCGHPLTGVAGIAAEHRAAPDTGRGGALRGGAAGTGARRIQLHLHRVWMRHRHPSSLQRSPGLLCFFAGNAGRGRGLLQRERLRCGVRRVRGILLGLVQLGRQLPGVLLRLVWQHGPLRLIPRFLAD